MSKIKYKTYIPQIAFEVTTECNYDCLFCYNIWKTQKHGTKKINAQINAISTLNQLFEIADVRNTLNPQEKY